MKIQVGLVEDDPNLVQSISTKLMMFDEVTLIWTARNGIEALEQMESEPADLLLMDINMPAMNGIEATSQVKKTYPSTKVIIHTVFDDNDRIFESILAGASGYLLKDEKPAKLIEGMREAMEGGAPMSRSIASKTLQLIRRNTEEVRKDFNLTKRELQILTGLSNGHNYQQIADDLFISPKTVRKHIENVYQKLQVHNKVDAVKLAIKYQIISTR
ncbi:MAG: response regulator transcription factor [Roseivirga sp.]|nr:response regulator transcription factor [Roseivirga sp.]